jgi:hypothetical protein
MRRGQKRIARGAGYVYDIKVQLGRKATVEAQFLQAAETPFFQRAEVEKPEFNGLLDLVCVLPCKNDPRYMGFKQLYPGHGMREAFRITKGCRQCLWQTLCGQIIQVIWFYHRRNERGKQGHPQ